MIKIFEGQILWDPEKDLHILRFHEYEKSEWINLSGLYFNQFYFDVLPLAIKTKIKVWNSYSEQQKNIFQIKIYENKTFIEHFNSTFYKITNLLYIKIHTSK